MVIALRMARRAIFNAPLLGEYEGNAKEIHFQKMIFGLGVEGCKNHFLKANNLNNNKKGNDDF